MARKKSSDQYATTQINVRLADALLGRLESIGEPLGIKKSQLIHQAVVEFVLRHERENSQSQAHQPDPRR